LPLPASSRTKGLLFRKKEAKNFPTQGTSHVTIPVPDQKNFFASFLQKKEVLPALPDAVRTHPKPKTACGRNHRSNRLPRVPLHGSDAP
jgi:hypothetical protein